MQRDQAGDGGVKDTFRRRLPVAADDAFVHHQMADVADQHQASARQDQGAAVGLGVAAVRGKLAVDGFAVFLKDLDQRSLAQPKPVAVGRNLVMRIDRRDRIFQIHDGCERGLNNHIGDTGRIGAADRMRAIDDHLDVQAIVFEQNDFRRLGAAAIAAQFLRVRKPGRLAVVERG